MSDPKPGDLLDRDDIARMLQVKRGTVIHWHSSLKIMPPVAKMFGNQPAWTRAAIAAWAVDTGRIGGKRVNRWPAKPAA